MSLAVRRALAGMVSQPTTNTAGTTIFTDAFTGTNGAAWGSNWTLGYTGTNGAAATIDTNRGKLTSGATGGYASTDRVMRRYTATIADFDVTLTLTLGTSEAFVAVGFRGDQSTMDFGNGYFVEFNATNLNLVAVSAGAYTTPGTVSQAHSLSTAYKVRIVANGASIQVRSWLASGTEPSSWDIAITNAALTTAGYFGVNLNGGGAAVSQTAFFDDVTATTIGTGGGATGGGTTGGGGTGGGGSGGGNTSTARFGIWHHSWQGPFLRNYPTAVKNNLTDVMLGIGQGNGDGSFGYGVYNGDTVAAHAADIRAFVAAGINVSVGVGGSNGGVRVLTQAHANQFVASVQSHVNTFGINGVNLDIESGEWDQIYLADACRQLRTMYGSGFQIQVTTSMWGPYTAPWMNFLNYLGHANYSWTGPMAYDSSEATTSAGLTSWVLSLASTMAAASVPADKMTMGFMLTPYAGYNASPNVGVVNTAYDALKAARPTFGGMWMWEDSIDAARSWEWSLGAKSHV